MDTWHDVGQVFKNEVKVEKQNWRGERSRFSTGKKKEDPWRESERGEEKVEREAPTSLYDLRSSVA